MWIFLSGLAVMQKEIEEEEESLVGYIGPKTSWKNFLFTTAPKVHEVLAPLTHLKSKL